MVAGIPHARTPRNHNANTLRCWNEETLSFGNGKLPDRTQDDIG